MNKQRKKLLRKECKWFLGWAIVFQIFNTIAMLIKHFNMIEYSIISFILAIIMFYSILGIKILYSDEE